MAAQTRRSIRSVMQRSHGRGTTCSAPDMRFERGRHVFNPRLTAIAVAIAAAACQEPVTGPTPSPVAVGAAEGAAVIEFVRATPEPGSTLINCGADLRGCLGQVTITVRLLSRVDGRVSMVTGTLHGDSKVACLSATSPPAVLRANSYSEVQFRFTAVDAIPPCAAPWNASNLAVLSYGTSVLTTGRQEFGIHYRFER